MRDDSAPTAPPGRSKLQALIVMGAALALLFVLAASVSDLQLLGAQPFAIPTGQLQVGATPALAGGEIFLLVMRVLIALSLLSLPLYIIMSILTSEGRRRLLRHLITLGALMLMLYALRQADIRLPVLEQDRGARRAQNAESATTPLPEAVFDNYPSDNTVLAVTVAVSFVLVLLAAGLIAAVIRSRRAQPSALDELAQDAQQAIDALKSGGALEETIQRCYRNMCEVVQRERRVERGIAVTPSEFELSLLKAGMPQQAVHQLTRLFEDIRYGGKQSGEREQRLAIDSLQAIVDACTTRPGGVTMTGANASGGAA
jgi:Domain of unknown function (DUF4129)